jgi:ketosteroid isomerase-like protein
VNCLNTSGSNLASLTETLIALERARCGRLMQQDFVGLKQLLSPDLIHTHTRGNTDTLSSYLDFMSRVIQTLELKREDLCVLPLGESAALMHGKQISRSRLRSTGQEVTVEAMVTQVWAKNADGQWQQIAFHATALGAPPPVAPR